MNMLDYTADQRIFTFERTSPFRGLLGGMFDAKIVNCSHPEAQLILAELRERINDEKCHSDLIFEPSATPVEICFQTADDIFVLSKLEIGIQIFVQISSHSR